MNDPLAASLSLLLPPLSISPTDSYANGECGRHDQHHRHRHRLHSRLFLPPSSPKKQPFMPRKEREELGIPSRAISWDLRSPSATTRRRVKATFAMRRPLTIIVNLPLLNKKVSVDVGKGQI